MPKTVTVVVTYAIPWERFPEWASAIVDLVDTVKAEVPRLTSYTVYITEDSSEATSIWVHPDTESLEQHLEAGAALIDIVAKMVQPSRVDIYGRPSERVVAQFRRISEESSGFPVYVKRRYYGSSGPG